MRRHERRTGEKALSSAGARTLRAVLVRPLLAVAATVAVHLGVAANLHGTPTNAEPPSARVNLLMLSSFHKDLPAQQQLEDGLDSVLHFRSGRHRVFVEYLDSARLSAPPQSLGLYLSDKYRDANLTLIVAFAPAAGQALAGLRATLPEVRRAYVELESPSFEQIRAADPRAVIVAAQHDYSPSLDESLRVTGVRHLLVVGETADVSAATRLTLFRRALESRRRDLKVEYLLDRPLQEVLARAGELGPGSAVYYLLMFSDGTRPSRPYDIAARIAERSAVPVLSPWESLLGSGVLGGYVISHHVIGEELGRLALSMGEATAGDNAAAPTPVVRVSGMRHAYDWRQLQRLGIDRSATAPGSSMKFEEPSVFERYGGRILAAAAIACGLLALSLSLWRINVARLRALDALDLERRRLKQAVDARTGELNDRLQELARRNEELRAAKDRLDRLANTDELTGLANRRHFDAVLQRELARLRRIEGVLSLVMLDVDHFKAYNDHYGHAQGDACLQAIARLLADAARRPADTAARFGGEEFMLILPHTAHDGALAVVAHVRAGLAASAIAHAASPSGSHVTVSAGVVTVPSRTAGSEADSALPSARQLVEIADKLLYRAKAEGRDRVSSVDLAGPS
ncbi:GGDEF domain-containing protein [Aquabacterium humicola]|uniref:GGDEF domain-containing protein n=1 Tax=Aquabacterium humicola TaxID=3237377 RepID=UPI002542A815|nr:GGDEF domain-containing protein [Rubrivivax pictus]